MTGVARIRIDRLALRLHGVPAETAREAAAGLGADLAGRLADASTPVRGGRLELGDLSLAPVKAPRGARASDLSSTIATEVAGAISRRLAEEAR